MLQQTNSDKICEKQFHTKIFLLEMLNETKERNSHINFSNILPLAIMCNGQKVLSDKTASPLVNARWLTVISRTAKFLFTTVSPYGPPQKDTIVRWVKNTWKKYKRVNTKNFSSQSCISSARSKADNMGMDLNTILKMRCWSRQHFKSFILHS